MGKLNQTLRLRQSDHRQMQEHVSRAFPEEACGIVGGIRNTSKVVFEVENSLHSPVRFLMEPNGQVQALIDIENSGLDLLAIYHSHPTGPATPSATDLSEFLYPGTYYLIWYPEAGEWTYKAYEISNDEFHSITTYLVSDE